VGGVGRGLQSNSTPGTCGDCVARVYTCMYTFRVYTFQCMDINTHAHICIHAHARTHTHTHTRVCVCMFVCVHVCVDYKYMCERVSVYHRRQDRIDVEAIHS